MWRLFSERCQAPSPTHPFSRHADPLTPSVAKKPLTHQRSMRRRRLKLRHMFTHAPSGSGCAQGRLAQQHGAHSVNHLADAKGDRQGPFHIEIGPFFGQAPLLRMHQHHDRDIGSAAKRPHANQCQQLHAGARIIDGHQYPIERASNKPVIGLGEKTGLMNLGQVLLTDRRNDDAANNGTGLNQQQLVAALCPVHRWSFCIAASMCAYVTPTAATVPMRPFP